MKSVFRATAILSGSSAVSIVLSLVSAKIMALILGPSGYGYFGLLQSVVGVVTIAAGIGMATGLVRLGAASAAKGDFGAVARLSSGAWLLFWAAGGVTLLIMTVFRDGLSRWSTGELGHGWTMPLMAVAVMLTVAGNIQTGTLNVYHKVEALATHGVANTFLAATLSIVCVWLWGIKGVVPAVMGGGVVIWAVSRYLLRREVKAPAVRPSKKEAVDAAKSLAHFGGPVVASMLVGGGVQLALPILVLHLLGTESVGYYRASVAISVGYLGFLITAMSQDYYPRAAALKGQPGALVNLVNEQHRLVMLLAAPMILGMIALVPYLIPLVYTPAFNPAVSILEWQLIGDLFKFSSWTLSFAILANSKSSVYFLTESIGGGVMLLFTWASVRMFGLPGLGISFLASYIVYYFVVWFVLRREIPMVWTAVNKKIMLIATAAAIVVRILPSTQFAYLRTPLALVLAVVGGSFSLTRLWREYSGRHKENPKEELVAS